MTETGTEPDGAGADDDLLAAAEELYGLPPDEFMAARNERANEAKASGRKELAQGIGKLRKPSSAAWLLNQLVRHHGEEVNQLLAVGSALREAQADLDSEQLKDLGRLRHQVVAALGRQARSLSRELGNPVSASIAEEVEQTLRAALADPAAGQAVTSGQMTKALDYAGMGTESVDLAGAVAIPGAVRTPLTSATPPEEAASTGDPAAERRQAELEQAQRDAEDGERDAADAEAALDRAQRRVEEIAERQKQVEDRLAKLEQDVVAARDELSAAGRDSRSVAHERDRAAKQAESARQVADRARARVARLSSR